MDAHQALLIVYTILFMVKHYLADKVWQTQYMGGKRGINYTWIIPLTSHVMVHVLTSLVILIIIEKLDFIWLLGIEFMSHFAMDRIKSAPYLLGRFRETKWRPYCTVLDQCAHGLTYIFMIWILVWNN